MNSSLSNNSENNIEYKYLIYLFIILTFLSLVAPFSYYHLFKGSVQIIYVLTIGITFITFCQKGISKKSYLCCISFFIVLLYLNFTSISVGGSIDGYQSFMLFFLFVAWMLLPVDYKRLIQNSVIKILAILLLFSLIEYLLFVFLGLGFRLGQVVRVEDAGSQYYHHLIFNLVKVNFIVVPRFQFIFDEPGRLGTLCALIFYILNGTKYHKQQLIFLISGLFTFSLAFYCLIVVSFVLLNITKFSLSKYLLFGIILVAAYYYLKEYVEALIISRIEKKGVQRTTGSFDLAFARMLNSNDIYWGYGLTAPLPEASEAEGDTVGLFREIYRTGIIGVVLRLLQYIYSIFLFNKINFRSIGFVIVFLLSYYQRAHIYDMIYLVFIFPFPLLFKK